MTRRALGALLLAGCARDPVIDTGADFVVVGCSPDDGADDVGEAAVPELRFSKPADPVACDTAAIRLDAVDGAGRVLSNVPYTPVFSASDEKLQLTHDVALPRGYTYAVSVATAASPTDLGCAAADGTPAEPYVFSFTVP